MFLTIHNGIQMSWRAKRWAETSGSLPVGGTSLILSLIRQGVCSAQDVMKAAAKVAAPQEKEAAIEWAKAIAKASILA